MESRIFQIPTIKTPTRKPVLYPLKQPFQIDPSCVLALLPQRDDKWFDYSGKGNHGSINGATWTARKGIGPALNFDGVDDYVNQTSPLSLIKSFTIEIWSLNSTQNTLERLIMNGKGGNSGWGVGRGPTDEKFRFTKAGVVDLDLDIGSWPTEICHAVWIVGNDSDIELFINGTSQGKYGNTSAIKTNVSNQFVLGVDVDGAGNKTKYWTGLIKTIRIYNRVLTADEIRRNYEMGRIR